MKTTVLFGLISCSDIIRAMLSMAATPEALIALIVGVAPNLPGFLTAVELIDSAPALLVEIYNYAWFVGAFTSGIVYYLLMRARYGVTRV